MGFVSWQHYCTALQYLASAKLSGVEQRAQRIFGRAAITLGIGPHSSVWATVYKKVRPMLSDCCQSVLSVCLSVTLVYRGQTVRRIKMKLHTQVGLGPGHIVLYGDPAPLRQRSTVPQFSAHICCGQMAA